MKQEMIPYIGSIANMPHIGCSSSRCVGVACHRLIKYVLSYYCNLRFSCYYNKKVFLIEFCKIVSFARLNKLDVVNDKNFGAVVKHH